MYCTIVLVVDKIVDSHCTHSLFYLLGFGVMVLVMNTFYIPLTMVQTSHFFINFMKLMIEHDLFLNCPVTNVDGSCYNKRIPVNITKGFRLCEHGDFKCPYKERMKYTTEYIYWYNFSFKNLNICTM